LSREKIEYFGNRKGDRDPLFSSYKLIRLICFSENKWGTLVKFTEIKPPQKKRKRKTHYIPGNRKNEILNSLPLAIPDTPERAAGKQSGNWFCDENRLWGDLTREEEIKLQNILKGKNLSLRD